MSNDFEKFINKIKTSEEFKNIERFVKEKIEVPLTNTINELEKQEVTNFLSTLMEKLKYNNLGMFNTYEKNAGIKYAWSVLTSDSRARFGSLDKYISIMKTVYSPFMNYSSYAIKQIVKTETGYVVIIEITPAGQNVKTTFNVIMVRELLLWRIAGVIPVGETPLKTQP